MTDKIFSEELGFSETFDLLSPQDVRFYRDEEGTLRLEIMDIGEYLVSKVVRAFPESDPAHYISFFDEKDDEIGIIANPEELEPISKKTLQEELEKVYFTLKITKVRSIKQENKKIIITAETDNGIKSFAIRGRENLYRSGRRRIIITDIEKTKYEVLDYVDLDDRSRVLLGQYL